MSAQLHLIDDDATRAMRARAVLPNQGLHVMGEAIAAAHPRAIQYLEAAPVLAASLPQADWRRRKAVNEYVRIVLEPLCEAGAPLRDVLRAFKLAPPMRKLTGYALAPGYTDLVLGLSGLDPRVLGRIIPERPGAQKRWLAACAAWRAHMMQRRRPVATRFAWAAEAISRAGVARRAIGTVADFALWPDSGFSEGWGWARATEEAHRWHARMTMERALAGSGLTPETVIDLGRHPDVATVAGLTFVALRTPLALYEEGAAMRHCVATYVNNVVSGDCHIVGVRDGERRVATVEMGRPPLWATRQIKGPANAEPPPEVVEAWRTYKRTRVVRGAP